MERFVTALIAGLCIAPIFFLVVSSTIWSRSTSGGPEDRMAGAYSSLFIGGGVALVAFILTLVLAYFLLARGHLRHIQIADIIMIAGWLIAWAIYAYQQPRNLEYTGYKPILYIEVRASKSLLKEQAISTVVHDIYCDNLSLYYYRSGQVRQEGNYMILPWIGYLHSVKEWDISVSLTDQLAYFTLNLPRYPTQSTQWSDWIPPTPQPGYIVPPGLSIRYRFQLIPENQVP